MSYVTDAMQMSSLITNRTSGAFNDDAALTKAIRKFRRLPFMPPWNSPRWSTFCFLMFNIYRKNLRELVLPSSILDILKNMAQDKNEPILYRCAASFHLSHFVSERTTPYFGFRSSRQSHFLESALLFYNSATNIERNRIVELAPAGTVEVMGAMRCTVASELERYKCYIDEDIRFAEDPMRYAMELMLEQVPIEHCYKELCGMQAMIRSGGYNISGLKTPEVTSSLIEQIKKLPEKKEVTVYLFEDSVEKFHSLGRQRTYLAVTVDEDKLKDLSKRKKKQHNAFKFISHSLTDYKHCREKAIIGAFAKTCLNPFAFKSLIIPSLASEVSPPFRPGKVLLEDKPESRHPQINSFLKMMGCIDVDIIKPDLAGIISQNKRNIVNGKHIADDVRKPLPEMTAIQHRCVCKNCNKADMNIKQCKCKKAYFCSEECQTAGWPAHKKEHKIFMKKLKAKAKK